MTTPSRHRFTYLRVFFWLATCTALFALAANLYIITTNRDRVFTEANAIPFSEVGLVLGTSAKLKNGQPNPFFENRIDAAARLFHLGKVQHLLVSGDNSEPGYDEPTQMKDALVARGVPAEVITCDFAGFRTLDSMIRAKLIFGLTRCIVISQRYHDYRALEIALAHGLDAVAFCAPDVAPQNAFRANLREIISRSCAIIDLYVLRNSPRLMGPSEPILLAIR